MRIVRKKIEERRSGRWMEIGKRRIDKIEESSGRKMVMMRERGIEGGKIWGVRSGCEGRIVIKEDVEERKRGEDIVGKRRIMEKWWKIIRIIEVGGDLVKKEIEEMIGRLRKVWVDGNWKDMMRRRKIEIIERRREKKIGKRIVINKLIIIEMKKDRNVGEIIKEMRERRIVG